jgi:serine/threonine protein kinase
VLSNSGKLIDQLVDQFAQDWVEGRKRPLEECLAGVAPTLHAELLSELMLMELELRHASGELPRQAEYLQRFPQFRQQVARVFEEFQDEFHPSPESSQRPINRRQDSQPKGDTSGKDGQQSGKSSRSRNARSVSLHGFLGQLANLELLPLSLIEELQGQQSKSVGSVAQDLVRDRRLTRFQAELLLRGEGDRLRVGKYLLEEPIGEGGMGKVYRGRNPRLKQKVAIKELSAHLVRDQQAVRRFLREIRLSAQASHPNLVRALDAEEQGGRLYLVMEYVPGQDLARFVKKNGQLSVPLAVDYLCQSAEGLQAAHELGIVHRDIKPGNLMRTTSGQIKILDLGMASCRAEIEAPKETDKTTTQLTGTAMFMGTLDYMAPEQAEDVRSAGIPSDLYSLGCTLYFLLTGRAPYSDRSTIQKAIAHASAPIPPLEDDRPDIPDALVMVYQRLMAKQPRDRYRSCAELLQELRRIKTLFLEALECPPPGESASVVGGQSSSLSAHTGDGWPLLDVHEHWSPRRPSRLTVVGNTARQLPKTVWVSLPILAVVLSGWWLFHRPSPPVDTGRSPNSVGAKSTAVATRQPPDEAADPDRDLWCTTPAYRRWISAIEGLPISDQVTALSQKLLTFNPQFDGHIEVVYDGSHSPTSVAMSSRHLQDISPLRALGDLPGFLFLKYLRLSKGNTKGAGRMTDLRPLRGLPLESLDLSGNPVTDLGPLQGMHLLELNLDEMTKLTSLDPIREMPLKKLSLERTESTFDDLNVLQDMTSLEILSLNGNRVIRSLHNLSKLRLRTLGLRQTCLERLDGLNTANLRELFLNQSGITNLDPLRQANNLQVLDCGEAWQLTDISPLANLPNLREVVLLQTGVTDLSPLKTLPRLTISRVPSPPNQE